ncbi:Fic family protein [Pontibacter silvestris]|uniref:Fic family protein n=1 Tax=Pontibacter silvestris TaxID=2305183 RepID=A0ABW4X1K6_9BACT|nr:DUF4172 domain-containing protein [Pontibacter silvestris]
MSFYIHLHPNWPHFTWDEGHLSSLLGEVWYVQGRIVGRMEALGFSVRSETMLQTLTQDVLKSTEIEGELLDPEQVRSSIDRRLGMDIAGLIPSDRHVVGVVEMMLDATQHYQKPLTKERLFAWQASLFPTGRSGMYKIITGAWRDNEKGLMQVVSGSLGRERVHYEAPDASLLEDEMSKFLDWFNSEAKFDPVLKAGIAHLWFVTIHPFDDGNGRVARALPNGWSGLSCLRSGLSTADDKLESVLQKAHFWDLHASTNGNGCSSASCRKTLWVNLLPPSGPR